MRIARLLVTIALAAMVWQVRAEKICLSNPRLLFRSADFVAEADVVERWDTASENAFVVRPVRIYRNTFTRARHATRYAVAAIHRSTACCSVGVAKGERVLLYAHLDPESGRLETDGCLVFREAEAGRHIRALQRWRWFWRLTPW